MIQYIQHKDFITSLQKLSQQGGEAKKIADKVYTVWGKATSALGEDPFHGLPLTNHGEKRIKHVRKYDFGGQAAYRLITIHDKKYCMFCFAGSHSSCDKWLNKNTGLTVTKSKGNEYEVVVKTINIHEKNLRTKSGSDYLDVTLYERLDKSDQERFFDLLPGRAALDIIRLTPTNTEDEIYNIVCKIDDVEVASLVFDALCALRSGDKNQAVARIDLHLGLSQPISELSDEELIEVNDGMTVKKIVVGSEEYKQWFRKFIDSAGYQDWMLFMHPAQEEIVNADFEGAAKLSGVSGSGKTCIVVNRAIRLAKTAPVDPILILTLNKSLAGLIQELVDYACPEPAVRRRIVVKSFFEMCQLLLNEFEPQNKKLHNDVTWKLGEHIDEIWREYYRCQLNVADAEVMLPIHMSLNSRGINPESYLHQELDWVRSAYCEENRSKYYEVERTGRAIPLLRHQREMVLKGLETWEKKMSNIGVIDYLGLSTKLFRYFSDIEPRFSAILVDEVQDFGTIELQIIRKLVKESVNDIFLAGDMAQHVLPKHQSFTEAAIDVPSSGHRARKITRNYRNSREILRAAYEIFLSTMNGDIIMDGEMELLDPDYANFSTPKPLLLKANSLEEEIAFAVSYLNDLVANDDKFKGCIAFAGYSMYEILPFAKKYDFKILDGLTGVLLGNIFVSDLEQTKGYEFDAMIVLNCNNDVLPPIDMPVEEQYRDSCRLYVAMTRAKRQLILSYSSEDPSKWLIKSKSYFEVDSWDEVYYIEGDNAFERPKRMSEFTNCEDENIMAMTGKEFIYTKYAIGLPQELQDKIFSLVDGRGRTTNGKRTRWKTIKDAYRDVIAYPHAKQEFGAQKTWREFKELIEKYQ